MKKKLIVGLVCIACFAGCSTSQTTAIKAEGTIITTVDVGMKVWANYVNAGKATASQIGTVEQAYMAYYNAQLISEAALEKIVSTGSTNNVDITIANASVSTAEGSLLTLLNQYIIK